MGLINFGPESVARRRPCRLLDGQCLGTAVIWSIVAEKEKVKTIKLITNDIIFW